MKQLVFALFFSIGFLANAQTINPPKLVVGIVIDQMRPDYLYRFYSRYGAGGFKRLMNEGFSCENTFIPYTPTYTAAGHSCIYTGSVPALNGIVGNNWYDKSTKKVVYCVDDSTVTPVGSSSAAGLMSPKNMWATSVADELRLSTNFKSKVIGISLKDRGAILPAGHSANAAYWFDNAAAGWISSSHYMQTLPPWMVQFNAKKLPDTYLAKSWNSLYPINTYTQSTSDDKTYEGALPGEDATFPHRTDNITTNKYESFKVTPHGNTYTVDAAKAAIEGEALGTRGVTDLLALSFSSPDYIGHTFGPVLLKLKIVIYVLIRTLRIFLRTSILKLGRANTLFF